MKQLTDISCLILAAGTASRMGDLKQLLPLGDSTILEQVIQLTLNENFSEIIAIIGYEKARIKSEITINNPLFRWMENEKYSSGQSTSLRLGIKKTKSNSFMVFLGDLPFIKSETVRIVFEKGKQMKDKIDDPFIIRPLYKNVAGHPVFFANLDYQFFQKLEGDQGAKALIKNIDRQIFIDVEDEGILLDIDTLADYKVLKNYSLKTNYM